MRARTKMMMDVAVQHARAAFASSCGGEEFRGCKVYEGSVWNGGTHVTVIVDRALCEAHATPPEWTSVESWIYDIRGDSIAYLGKEGDARTAGLLKEPGDAPPPTESWPPKKST